MNQRMVLRTPHKTTIRMGKSEDLKKVVGVFHQTQFYMSSPIKRQPGRNGVWGIEWNIH
jgi:hypothetical protein